MPLLVFQSMQPDSVSFFVMLELASAKDRAKIPRPVSTYQVSVAVSAVKG